MASCTVGAGSWKCLAVCVLSPYARPWRLTINDCLVTVEGQLLCLQMTKTQSVIYIPNAPHKARSGLLLKSYPAWPPGSISSIKNLRMNPRLRVCFLRTVIPQKPGHIIIFPLCLPLLCPPAFILP